MHPVLSQVQRLDDSHFAQGSRAIPSPAGPTRLRKQIRESCMPCGLVCASCRYSGHNTIVYGPTSHYPTNYLPYNTKGEERMLDLELVVDIASDLLLRDGNHPPMVHVEGSNTSLFCRLANHTEFDMTDEAFAEIGAYVATTHGIGLGDIGSVIFISEAWLSIVSPHVHRPMRQPSDDPNKLEVLMVAQYVVQTGKTQTVNLTMNRDSHGELTELTRLPRQNSGVEANCRGAL